jgi:hypothetical protein
VTWPTDAEAQAAVEETAISLDGGLSWTWNPRDPDGVVWHLAEDARRIAKACLYLGVRVDSTVSAAMWFALVKRVAFLSGDIDDRVSA